MKCDGNLEDLTCTQRQMSQALKLSAARINQLIDENIMIRDEQSRSGRLLMFESLQNYFLSKRTTGDDVNFWKERGLHERAKRELAELKLSKSRGEVYEASAIEGLLSEVLTNFRSKLTGLPSKYASQLVGKNVDEIYELLSAAIEEELLELSEGLRGEVDTGIAQDIEPSD